jgi:hypothetical protein
VEGNVAGKLRGILQVIEYLDPTGKESLHGVPEGGSGGIVLGSQCIVRENQVLQPYVQFKAASAPHW